MRALVERALERYMAARRERVAGSVDRHFGLFGSPSLHRDALGSAPADVALVLSCLSKQLGGAALRRPGPLSRRTSPGRAAFDHTARRGILGD